MHTVDELEEQLSLAHAEWWQMRLEQNTEDPRYAELDKQMSDIIEKINSIRGRET